MDEKLSPPQLLFLIFQGFFYSSQPSRRVFRDCDGYSVINIGKDAKTKEGKEPKSDKEKEEFERRMEEADDPAEMFDLIIEERKEAHVEVSPCSTLLCTALL